MFVSIDDTFLIRENIPYDLLDKCLNFIINQRNFNRTNIENAYKENSSKPIKILVKFYDEEVDIIIKTKFNKDLKFVNIKKSLIFNEYNFEVDKLLKKIDKFQLEKIKFFPKTYLSKNIVFQNLARGNSYLPDKLPDFSSNLLSNIAKVINELSLKNVSKTNISSYIAHFKFSKEKDPLNFKIINNFILLVNNYLKDNIKTSLTHGDFKFEHLFIFENNLEYLVDWENVGVRSIFFDLMNFFTPWFVKRSYNYSQIKNYISKFIVDYLPNLKKDIENKFDIYFCLYALERYMRMYNSRTIKFDLDEAYKRYNSLFKNLSEEIRSEY